MFKKIFLKNLKFKKNYNLKFVYAQQALIWSPTFMHNHSRCIEFFLTL